MTDPTASSFPCAGARSSGRCSPERGDLLVVAGLGSTAWDATAAGDHPLTFPLWGAMGSAAMIGLGLALAQPERRVLVITGDGELLMGAGLARHHRRPAARQSRRGGARQRALRRDRHAGDAHRARRRPRRHRRGGGLPGRRHDPRHRGARTRPPGDRATEPGPVFYAIKVRAEPLPFVMPPKDGAHLKDRFRLALLLGPAARRGGPPRRWTAPPMPISRPQGAIAQLVLNRPDKRNALSLAMWQAIPQLVGEAAADPEVKVLILRGATAEAFSAGADIAEFDEVHGSAAAGTRLPRRGRRRLRGRSPASRSRPSRWSRASASAAAARSRCAATCATPTRSARFCIPPARLGPHLLARRDQAPGRPGRPRQGQGDADGRDRARGRGGAPPRPRHPPLPGRGARGADARLRPPPLQPLAVHDPRGQADRRRDRERRGERDRALASACSSASSRAPTTSRAAAPSSRSARRCSPGAEQVDQAGDVVDCLQPVDPSDQLFPGAFVQPHRARDPVAPELGQPRLGAHRPRRAAIDLLDPGLVRGGRR